MSAGDGRAKYFGREEVRVRLVKEAVSDRASLTVACSTLSDHDLTVNSQLYRPVGCNLSEPESVGPGLGFDVWDTSPNDAGLAGEALRWCC